MVSFQTCSRSQDLLPWIWAYAAVPNYPLTHWQAFVFGHLFCGQLLHNNHHPRSLPNLQDKAVKGYGSGNYESWSNWFMRFTEGLIVRQSLRYISKSPRRLILLLLWGRRGNISFPHAFSKMITIYCQLTYFRGVPVFKPQLVSDFSCISWCKCRHNFW